MNNLAPGLKDGTEHTWNTIAWEIDTILEYHSKSSRRLPIHPINPTGESTIPYPKESGSTDWMWK